MKIGIDISQIVYEGTGVARFTNGLTKAILEFDKKNEWTFFFSSLRRNLDPELETQIRSKGHKMSKWRLPPTLLSILWNDLHYPSKLLTFNFKLLTSLDWFITSDWTEPPLPVSKATIVHDLVYIRYPQTVDNKILETQKKRLDIVKKESQLIFADSQATKSDLKKLLSVNENKIVVNYPGIEIKKSTPVKIKETLNKYKLHKPFILTVGKREPRKNLQKLVKAFQSLKNNNVDLVIVGMNGWEEELQSFNPPADATGRLEFNSRVKVLGYISDDELVNLYSSCLFFIYPSIWEGFGYPVVEAMKLGSPVATSNTSSLIEITQDAALLFNPEDVDEMGRCIDKLVNDQRLRQEFRRKGLERSKIFTWLTYYRKMMDALSSH